MKKIIIGNSGSTNKRFNVKKVAVLIPTSKPGNYIEKCLLSIENQTLSKDKYCVYIGLNGPRFPYENYVLQVLSKMSFRYKYLYIPKAGVSNARNILIESSHEDFIVFLDDDDLISENYLENLLKVSTHEYIGISNIYNFKNNLDNLKENYIGKTFNFLNDGETSKYKIRKYFSPSCGKMIHRNMIGNIKFDEKVSKGEDSLFMAMISKNVLGIRKTSKDTCYYVHERIGSLTRRKSKISMEIKTNFYLTYKYLKLLYKKEYDKVFILTRIVATLLKLLKIR